MSSAGDPTQLARSAHLLIDYAVENGMELEELMQASGLVAKDLVDPDARIRTAKMLKLWREVIAGLNDPAVGMHCGTSIKTLNLGLVGYAMQHSRSLYGALNRLSRYGRILSEAVIFRLKETGEGANIVWRGHLALETLRHPVEAAVATLVAVGREITGTDLTPIRITLQSPIPEEVAEYRSWFRCPIEFGRPVASLTFSHEQLQLPALLPDSTLLKYLDDLAATTLGPLVDRDASMVAKVRRELWSALAGGRTNLWRTAADMGISARTLQRRLGEEHSSFSRVLDDLRRDLSEELLTDRKLSVAQVAFLLGYSEPSAFQRAYRRWRGVSPRRYRSA